MPYTTHNAPLPTPQNFFSKIKLPLRLIKTHVMKAYVGVEVHIHVFLTSALDEAPVSLSPGIKTAYYPFERRLGGSRVGLDAEKSLTSAGNRTQVPLFGNA
jgi:hypothetical protein